MGKRKINIDEEESLAVEVRKYVFLYDKTCKDYKNKRLRLDAWQKIEDELGLEEGQGEIRFDNLKKRYTRRKFAVKKGKYSGKTRELEKVEYWLKQYSFLKWLDPYLAGPETSSIFQLVVPYDDSAAPSNHIQTDTYESRVNLWESESEDNDIEIKQEEEEVIAAVPEVMPTMTVVLPSNWKKQNVSSDGQDRDRDRIGKEGGEARNRISKEDGGTRDRMSNENRGRREGDDGNQFGTNSNWRKRKVPSSDEHLATRNKRLQETKNDKVSKEDTAREDNDDLFGKMVANELRALSKMKKAKMKHEINNIIFKYQCGNDDDEEEERLPSTGNLPSPVNVLQLEEDEVIEEETRNEEREEKRRKRKIWVRDSYKNRETEGIDNLVATMRLSNRDSYFNFFRMSPERMEHLLHLVAPLITKKDTNFRKAISAEHRLMLTLRYLALGGSQNSLTELFRMGKKTVSRIVNETSEAIYISLKDTYLASPKKPDQWKDISNKFLEKWQLPHVLGAIDGKHIRIKTPKSDHNDKGYFSIQLLAVCNANCIFTYVDIGQYGSNNDCAVLDYSNLGRRLAENTLGIPSAEDIPGINDDVPYYLLGDEIFPLEPWLMRPYTGILLEPEQIYNYRHSRGRIPIENTFGILTDRWRIFENPIPSKPKNVESYTMACISLHNYLSITESSLYTPGGYTDIETHGGDIQPGDWRNDVQLNCAIQPIAKLKGRRMKDEAKQVRDQLKSYFKDNYILAWQHEKVTTVRPLPDPE